MRFRPAVFLAALMALASPVRAQSTDAQLSEKMHKNIDSVSKYQPNLNLRSKRSLLRLSQWADSIRLNSSIDTLRVHDTVTVNHHDTTVVTVHDTTVRVVHDTTYVDSTPTPATPPVDSAVRPPVTVPPVVFTHPYSPPSNGAALAELPRDTVGLVVPASTRTINVTASTLQAALDSAKTGDLLVLGSGQSATDLVVRPTARTGWVTIKGADSTSVIKDLTGGAVSAINILSQAHHVRFKGPLTINAGTDATNAIIRSYNGETTVGALAHDIIFDSVKVDSKGYQVRRCVWLDGLHMAVVNSRLLGCASSSGDAQGIININGGGPYRYENNYIEGGHQCFMSGGADPAILNSSPSDIVFRNNYCFKPAYWHFTTPGSYTGVQRQVKTIIETKNVKRLLVEGNILRNVWTDAQAGFCFLLKSTNQDGTAPNSQTADVTVRYNRCVSVASGVNLAARPQGGIPMTRVSIYDNKFDSLSTVGGEGIALQILDDVSDMVIMHNTFSNATNNAISFDSRYGIRTSIISNIIPNGQYGVKGAATGIGNATLNLWVLPSGLFRDNEIVGGDCAQYPATTTCSLNLNLTGTDGKKIGADTTKLPKVVVPPSTPAGVSVFPGSSIQTAVNANPTGTTFILKAGTHLAQSVIPKDSDTFRGEAGTVLDGQGTTQFAFKGWNNTRWVNGVKIINMAITKYNPPAQNGPIWGGDDLTHSTTGWVLDSLDISSNANVGIRIGNRMQVLRTKSHNNGTMGIGGVGNYVLVDGLESSYNNNGCPNNPGFESGGSKFVLTDSLIVRNSFFHHNCGPGLWLDISNIHYDVYNNRSEDNIREGIVVEIGFAGLIHGNSVSRNGFGADPFRTANWLWNAGIGIHESKDVEVYGNTLVENFNGIAIIQQKRDSTTGDLYAPTGGYLAQNVYVHDNTITQRNPQAAGLENSVGGAVQDVGNNAVFTSRNNRWVHNTYNIAGRAKPFTWMNTWRTPTEWKGYGQDSTGVFNP